jgi:acyl-CoA reductase-like NAD-dependent aldehyde dehydrogenase
MNTYVIPGKQETAERPHLLGAPIPPAAGCPPMEIPCIIGGRPVYNLRDTVLSEDYLGRPVCRIHRASPWTVEAAIESASRTQRKLAALAPGRIMEILSRTMEYYFTRDEEIDVVVSLTGASRQFVSESFQQMKSWCRDLDALMSTTLSRRGREGWLSGPTAPVVAVLPGNSESESLYVFAQVLLSRNAAVIRPSSKGAGAYVAWKFIEAYQAALRDLSTSEESEEYGALQSAFSVVHTSSASYLEQLAVDTWNYVVFGSDETMRRVDGVFSSRGVKPRTVARYGTGFSATILLADARVDGVLREIADSVTVNCGNECDSTDVVYVAASLAEEFTEKLTEALSRAVFGDPDALNSNGLLSAANQRYIEEQLHLRGRAVEGPRHPDSPARVLRLHAHESAMEYPGPIVSVRAFASIRELSDLIEKDLRDNGMRNNLVSSVYTPDRARFLEVVPLLHAHTVRHNRPTHAFDPNEPHQGMFLLEELSEFVYCGG